MEGIDAMNKADSLLEGMDFVLSSPLDMVGVGIAPSESVSAKNVLAVSAGASEFPSTLFQSSHQGGLESDLAHHQAVASASSPLHLSPSVSVEFNSVRATGDPLDESLFSGLSFISIDAINPIRETRGTSEKSSQKDPEFLRNLRLSKKDMVGELPKPEATLFKKVTAEVQSNNSARNFTAGSAKYPAFISAKSLTRRKKRGLEIGYGGDDDSEESSLNRTAPKVIDKDFGVLSMVSDFGPEIRIQGLQAIETARLEDISICPVVGQMSTFEEKFLAIKDFGAEKIMVANEELASATCMKKFALQKRRQASENVSVASLQRKELEIKLELCEKEDFEMAETLNEKIAEAERDMEVAEGSVREAEETFDSAVVKSQEIIDLQINIEEEGAQLLEELMQEAEAVAERVKKEADKLAADENLRLVTLEEEIELKKRKIVLELRVIDEAGSYLEKVIAESTKAESAEKLILIDKRGLLEEELKDLMARVMAKKYDIAEHDKQIVEMDEKTSGVLLKFEMQRIDLEFEAKSMSSLLKELNEESMQIQSEKLRLEGTLLKADEERINLENVAKAAMDEWAARKEALNMRKNAALAALQAREKKRELVVREIHASKEAQVLRQEAMAARTRLQRLVSTRVKLQQEICTVQQRISHAEKHSHELESEQRIAATARNFKEAARLATEAKIISAEEDALTLGLDNFALDLQKLDQEVESKVFILADTEGAITGKEKEAAKARCELLRLIARAAREERDPALGLEDFEAAESLDVEADAADSEADELQKIHELQGEQYEKITIAFYRSLNKSKEENLTCDDKEGQVSSFNRAWRMQ